ncbi:DUF2188 domain-containing protein [Saccharopolyspora pogona]|uniref:DUF2188 domain-containing protein n=1 Tax=Saccharopolyspora pogona TaxID=333966 RepID=UPI0016845B87|nr:DUF2188 domain-containing protein [Saccharopolyspora pogona]
MGTWRVRWCSDGRWQVRTPGGTQACARTNRDHAVNAACALARIEGGGVVLVEDAQGDLEWRRTVLWDEPTQGI